MHGAELETNHHRSILPDNPYIIPGVTIITYGSTDDSHFDNLLSEIKQQVFNYKTNKIDFMVLDDGQNNLGKIVDNHPIVQDNRFDIKILSADPADDFGERLIELIHAAHYEHVFSLPSNTQLKDNFVFDRASHYGRGDDVGIVLSSQATNGIDGTNLAAERPGSTKDGHKDHNITSVPALILRELCSPFSSLNSRTKQFQHSVFGKLALSDNFGIREPASLASYDV